MLKTALGTSKLRVLGAEFYSGMCSLWMYVMFFNSMEKYW